MADLQPCPAPRGRRRTVRQVSWLPDLPTPGPSHTGNPPSGGSTARSGTSPVSYPVTVAGAAPESHRLPFRGRRTSLQGGVAVTAPSVCQRETWAAGAPIGDGRSAARRGGGGLVVR